MKVDIESIRARAKVGITYVTVEPNSDWPDGSAEQADADRDVLLAEVDALRAAITEALDPLVATTRPNPADANIDAAIVTLRLALGIKVGP